MTTQQQQGVTTPPNQEKAIKVRDPATLMRLGERGLVMRHIDDLISFSKLVYESGMAPESFETPQQIFVAVQMGMELGLTPMASLRTICVVNGRACIWGDGKLALVRQSGLLARLEETIEGQGDKRTATCKAWRRGHQEPTIGTFSIEQAKQADLMKKDNWRKYTDRMLQHRARYAINDAFPDVLFGLLTVEEAQDLATVAGSFDPSRAVGAEPQDRIEHLVDRIGRVNAAPQAPQEFPVEEPPRRRRRKRTEDEQPAPEVQEPQGEPLAETEPDDDFVPSPVPQSAIEAIERDGRAVRPASLCALDQTVINMIGADAEDAAGAVDRWLRFNKWTPDKLSDPGMMRIAMAAACRADWKGLVGAAQREAQVRSVTAK